MRCNSRTCLTHSTAIATTVALATFQETPLLWYQQLDTSLIALLNPA